MTPEAAKIAAQFYLDDFELEMNTTARVINSVPDANPDYRPDPKSRTALELCRHIVLEDEWLLEGIADGLLPEPPDQSDACGLMTPGQCLEYYNSKLPASMERVRGLSGDTLIKEMDLLGIMVMPAIAFVSLAVRHSVHHRAQLGTYLRPMGGAVPSIYGPSADTPMD